MMSYGDVIRATPRVLVLVVAILAAATTATWSSPDGRRVDAWVVRVIDGDTLVARLATVRSGLQKNEKVRLVGTDCPEVRQQWGPPATARLAALVLGRSVILEIALQSRDRYGRLLVGLYLTDGNTLVQEILVREGFCQTLVIPPNVEYVEQLRAAKIDAQRAERGIWARTGGLTESPAEYRRRHR
jgi:micrococcal nuclease